MSLQEQNYFKEMAEALTEMEEGVELVFETPVKITIRRDRLGDGWTVMDIACDYEMGQVISSIRLARLSPIEKEI